MPFLRDDLAGNHYDWNAVEVSAFTGGPSRRLFNRYNGDQVLFMINHYESLSDNFTLQDGKKIEQMLLNELPETTKSEISVFNWLRDSF